MAENFEVGGPLPEESANRTFLFAAAGLGALLVLSMICLGAYVFFFAPGAQQRRIAQATSVPLTNTAVARQLTEEAGQALVTPSATPTNTVQPTATASITPTLVVVLPTDTPFTTLETVVPITETAAARQTAAAAQQATPTPTATALPVAGFADEAGVSGLLLAGLVLIVVVFVTRQVRLRTAD